jgi:dihydrofolate synthase/folylpolyglutamate synthase
MDYQSAVDYIFNQLANYQKVGSSAYKPGLETITSLLNRIGNPHKSIKTVHIAGTNGKGSTAHILASIFIENGYKVGLFTSPHIKDFRERIKINGQLISKNDVVSFINEYKPLFDELNLSFFEISTALAFYLFNKYKCDISIIETGLGGRLDSTNVIQPEVSVITNIGIDHTNFLGTTLPQIAKEKAGIIKKNIPVVYGGSSTDEAYRVIKGKALKEESGVYTSNKLCNIKTDLLGQFQQQNCSVALTTIKILKQKGWHFDNTKSNMALTKVQKNTNFHGRLEQISNNPRIIIDASHNVDGVKNLFKEIELMNFNNLHCIYATSSDKAVNQIITLFPKKANYYLTTFNSKRSYSLNKLASLAKTAQLNFSIHIDAEDALNSAKQHYKPADLIVVFGSFFLLEKIM